MKTWTEAGAERKAEKRLPRSLAVIPLPPSLLLRLGSALSAPRELSPSLALSTRQQQQQPVARTATGFSPPPLCTRSLVSSCSIRAGQGLGWAGQRLGLEPADSHSTRSRLSLLSAPPPSSPGQAAAGTAQHGMAWQARISGLLLSLLSSPNCSLLLPPSFINIDYR
jgi:anti-sigma factor RsiW